MVLMLLAGGEEPRGSDAEPDCCTGLANICASTTARQSKCICADQWGNSLERGRSVQLGEVFRNWLHPPNLPCRLRPTASREACTT